MQSITACFPASISLSSMCLTSRFGIERHPYTKSRIDQFRVYVCMCVPISIKIIPASVKCLD